MKTLNTNELSAVSGGFCSSPVEITVSMPDGLMPQFMNILSQTLQGQILERDFFLFLASLSDPNGPMHIELTTVSFPFDEVERCKHP